MEWFVLLVSAVCMIAVLAVSLKLWLHDGYTTKYLEVKAEEFRRNDECLPHIQRDKEH